MIEKLKEDILRTFGSELQYTKDCKILSQKVFEQTGQMLSTTTIRRMFGFLKSDSSPSKFTLNVLSRYVGVDSWCEYVNIISAHEQDGMKVNNKWNQLYDQALRFSQYTFNLIVEQSGIPFPQVVPREFANTRIQQFLESSATALSFVAPGGYGKSTMLAKWFQYNWLEKKSEDVIFFLNAGFLINFIDNDFKLERWLQDQLKGDCENFLSFFLDNPEECCGRLIIVIDSLDEITYDEIKLERLFQQLTAFIANHKAVSGLKIVITSRNTTWKKFAFPILCSGNKQKQLWFESNLGEELLEKTTMHPLDEMEIQQILNNTINKQFKPSLLWEELGFRLKQTLSYPYFLELFTKLYDPSGINNLNEGMELLNDFLRKKIHYSRYSEEKVDIIRGILQLQDMGRRGLLAKKNDLKAIYPVHLKSAGNYFNAYEEMLSYGIISEVLQGNTSLGYIRYVQIPHRFLFELLVVRMLVEENQGIDFSLFLKVEKEFEGFEYKNRLIGLIFELAYSQGEYDALANFFTLSKDTLQDAELMSSVGRCFRNLKGMGIKLLKHYAQDKKAGVYLFEKFIDHNYVMGSYKVFVDAFMNSSQGKSVLITCAGILLQASVYSLNADKARYYYNFLLENEPDNLCSTYSIALRLSSIILYRLYFSHESNEIPMMKIFYFREMAYSSQENAKNYGDGEFELVVCHALIQMKAWNKMLQFIDDVEQYQHRQATGYISPNYFALQCYKLYAQSALGACVDKEKVDMLEIMEREMTPARGFILHAIYNSFMANYCFNNGERPKAQFHLDKCIEICEYAHYDLCTALLMDKMAMFYANWNEPKKEKLCLDERDALLGEYRHTINTRELVV